MMNHSCHAPFLQFCLVVSTLISAPAALGGDDHWPQWRGPGGRGISDGKDFPLQWGEGRNIAWKTALPGRGHSSPIVWGDKIFLTAAVRGEKVSGAKAATHYRSGEVYRHPQSEGADHRHQMKVLCLDRETGRVLWERTAFEGTPYDDRHRRNTYASGTPVADGERVYAFFDAEGLYCYDFRGNLVWKASMGRIAKAGMGYGMSPVLYRDLIIVQVDRQGLGVRSSPDPPPEGAEKQYGEDSFIAALDKRTGKEAWRTPRNHRRSWATPILVEHAGRSELIASGAESIVSYNPATGEEHWRSEGVVSHPIPSPVAGHGMVFVTAGSQDKHALAIRLGGSGDVTGSGQIVWKYPKGTAYVPSPILYGDYLYLLTDRGVVTCLEAKTGEVVYRKRLPMSGYRASPVAFDGKILFTSADGDTHVIQAGPRFELLATSSIGEPVWASPALSRGRIFIRGAKHLYAIADR